MKFYRILICILCASAALTSMAAPIDDAKKLYRQGEYQAAVDKLRPLYKRSPKDGTVNYYLGASLVALGESSEAGKYLLQAESRGVADASRMLAEIAIDQYRPDDAEEHLDEWVAILHKGKKNKAIPEQHADLTSRMVQMRNMMERVEKIEILDSLSVDSVAFFQAYRLAPSAGRILPADAVESIAGSTPGVDLMPAYMPENRSELLWSQSDSTSTFALWGAGILDDGTIDHPAPLGGDLGEGGDAIFPFMMPDGVTLYFANNGKNSLGGYDIFMTRRSDGGEFYQPQNVGMPYNSPYNDYLLAIDETSGLGWWATDRNAEPGKVTVYVFAPSQVRVNVEPDDENLSSLARLSDISLTRREGVDYKALLAQRLPADDDSQANYAGTRRFAIDMGNGKVYTSLSDFRSKDARSAMIELIGTSMELASHLEREEALRDRFRKGDTSVRHDILDSERETARLRKAEASLRNKVVRLERN